MAHGGQVPPTSDLQWPKALQQIAPMHIPYARSQQLDCDLSAPRGAEADTHKMPLRVWLRDARHYLLALVHGAILFAA